MANQTTPVFQNSQFTLSIRYDDVTGSISRFTWTNLGGGTATCTLARRDGSQSFTQVVPPPPDAAADGFQNVPAGLRQVLTQDALETGEEFTLDVEWRPIRQ